MSMNTLRQKGFSTIELMIAFALMSLIFGGVILADFSANYWAIAAETSNEGLYKAKTRLEELRAVVKKDFRMASSSPAEKVSDSYCDQGGLCYFVETIVSDLSSCSKYVQAQVEWQVSGYPTTTTALFTNLTDADEAVRLGGDCPLVSPEGDWTGSAQAFSASAAGVTPLGIDVLGSFAYVVSGQGSRLHVGNQSSFLSFANGFIAMDPLNDIDVARDIATGRTYAYAAIASTSVQLEVIDMTDINNPVSLTKIALNGVSAFGSQPQGWRVVYYDRTLYVVTRETDGPEFHVIDVSNPVNPTEVGSFELTTSAYDLVVRDVMQGNTPKRLIFLATTENDKELLVLDATNPAAVAELTNITTNIPGDRDGRAVFLSGNTVYLGMTNTGGNDLYLLDAKNLFGVVGGLPTLSSVEIGGDVLSIRVSEPRVFVGRSGQLQVFSIENGNLSSPITHTVTGLAGIDMEGRYVYTAGTSPTLQIIQSQ